MAKAAITRETENVSPIKRQPPISPTSPFSGFNDPSMSTLSHSSPQSQSLGSPTLAAIKEGNPDLSPVMEYLDRLNNSVTDLNESIAALRADMHLSQTDQQDKIAFLDEKISTKHIELSDKLFAVDLKLETYDVTINSARALGETNQTELHKLAIIVHQQQTIISSLQATIDSDRITSQKNYNELLVLTNSVEAHQRRWAVRIFGIDAPPDNTVEQTPRSKALVVDFIVNQLKIDNITIDDIDTAHRVGRKDQDGKQTMLTRLFSRDLIQLMTKKRRLLKDSDFVLHDDLTLRDRKLLWDLKRHPNVESAWSSNGSIWSKPISGEKSNKVTIGDNLEDKLRLPTPPEPTVPVPEEVPADAIEH
jgi:hypothetical protein